jgi:sulfur carrier protein
MMPSISVNGEPMEWRPGMKVRDILRERKYVFPLLIVRVDGVLVPRSAYDASEVPDGARVDVIHLMSGG